MKNSGTSYILWLLGFFGLAGIHRFYLGRPISGLLWLFTGGLLGVGTLLDALLIPGMVRDENRKALLDAGTLHLHLHGDPGDVVTGSLLPAQEAPRALPPADSPEKQILRVAAVRDGFVTAQLVALETSLSLADAKRELDALAKGGYCTVDVGEDGAEHYRVIGLTKTKPLLGD